MDQSHGASGLLLLPVLLLAVAVISVPLARLLRLSAIVAYLAAGVVIGPYGFRPGAGARDDHHGVRARRRPAAVPDRPRTRILAPAGAASRHIRPRRRPARRHRGGIGRSRLWARAHRLARRRHRRARTGIVGDRHRAENPGGARPAPTALRPARLRDPAVPGHVGGAVAGAAAAARARRRQPRRRIRRYAHRGRPDRPVHRHRGGGRALSAQPVPRLARQHRRPRGDDGGRAAGRARRRRPHAVRRHVDGARRLPRRRDAGGIELPPRARSRHRAVSRPAASAVLHGRRHVDRHGRRLPPGSASSSPPRSSSPCSRRASWPCCFVPPARTAATARAPARCSPPPANSPSC